MNSAGSSNSSIDSMILILLPFVENLLHFMCVFVYYLFSSVLSFSCVQHGRVGCQADAV